jgi:hypothetical protein
MAWENFKVEQQRLNVMQAYKSGLCSIMDICKQYGIRMKFISVATPEETIAKLPINYFIFFLQ